MSLLRRGGLFACDIGGAGANGGAGDGMPAALAPYSAALSKKASIVVHPLRAPLSCQKRAAALCGRVAKRSCSWCLSPGEGHIRSYRLNLRWGQLRRSTSAVTLGLIRCDQPGGK